MMDSSIDSIVWGKWIALACLIAAVIVIIISIRFYSIRRMRQGHGALPGTGWMALPTYTAAEIDREGLPEVAAPPYNPQVGEFDAGFYDKNGNFVARPRRESDPEPPQPAQSSNRHEPDEIALQELPQTVEPQQSAPPQYNIATGRTSTESPAAIDSIRTAQNATNDTTTASSSVAANSRG